MRSIGQPQTAALICSIIELISHKCNHITSRYVVWPVSENITTVALIAVILLFLCLDWTARPTLLLAKYKSTRLQPQSRRADFTGNRHWLNDQHWPTIIGLLWRALRWLQAIKPRLLTSGRDMHEVVWTPWSQRGCQSKKNPPLRLYSCLFTVPFSLPFLFSQMK